MAEQGSGKKTWIKACGIGCLVLVVLAAAAGFGIYKVGSGMLAEGAGKIAAQTGEGYAQAKADGKVPEEHAALFDSVVENVQADGASFLTVAMSATTVLGVFDDGELSEEEVGDAKTVLDFLTENPNPGAHEVSTFLDEHPDLKARVMSRIAQFKQE